MRQVAAELVGLAVAELDSLVELAVTTPPRTYSVGDGQPNISSPRRLLSAQFYEVHAERLHKRVSMKGERQVPAGLTARHAMHSR